MPRYFVSALIPLRATVTTPLHLTPAEYDVMDKFAQDKALLQQEYMDTLDDILGFHGTSTKGVRDQIVVKFGKLALRRPVWCIDDATTRPALKCKCLSLQFP